MTSTPMELWAGPECSVVRVGDHYVDQVERTGHAARLSDLGRLASLGVRAVRYPVLWERTAPRGLESADWSFADERLSRLRELGIRPIVGLVHHGSGPRRTSLLDESFVTGLAAFARAVAERYPWIEDFTPVNEPLTTARFSGLYGHWYPHARTDVAFVRALVVECAAIGAAMRAIREVTPGARLVQTEDVATVFSTCQLGYQARFENARRFASLDLLTGRVDRCHPLRGFLRDAGASDRTLDALAATPCTPDVVGLNYYLTSDRYLDERVERYPPAARGGNGRERYADVEAVRVRSAGITGHAAALRILWRRYGLPLAITEAHLGCTPEEQIRWLVEAWEGAEEARAAGADVRAVTLWSVFGAYDWDSLLAEERGHYEPGAFDVRGGIVRPTALAAVARDLATRRATDHPLAHEPGWWRRDERILYPAAGRTISRARSFASRRRRRPVLVTGASGTLGRALARVLSTRGLDVVSLTRAELDMASRDSIARVLARIEPWAVVNAAGYVRVDDAEREPARCFRENVTAAAAAADACAARRVRLVTFSSDLVFDGEKRTPYVEQDPISPLNVYGASKVAAERAVLERWPEALVVRTAAFFGPWDEHNFVVRALARLRAGLVVEAADDQIVSPTYVPDLCESVVTLLVDGASGTFHLANGGAVAWSELARRAAEAAGLSADGVVACKGTDLGLPAARPAFSALVSARGALLPPLGDALARFVVATAPIAPAAEAV